MWVSNVLICPHHSSTHCRRLLFHVSLSKCHWSLFLWSQRRQAVGTPSGTVGTASILAHPVQRHSCSRAHAHTHTKLHDTCKHTLETLVSVDTAEPQSTALGTFHTHARIPLPVRDYNSITSSKTQFHSCKIWFHQLFSEAQLCQPCAVSECFTEWVIRLEWTSGLILYGSWTLLWARWFQSNRKWDQLSSQSTALDPPQEMHHMSSVVRDVDVVMVFRRFSPRIGLSVNPFSH